MRLWLGGINYFIHSEGTSLQICSYLMMT
jgi:hypothetical protein